MNRLGIIYGILAGAVWALGYVLPLLVSSFTAMEITVGRYLAYGILSTGFWLYKGKRYSSYVWKMALVFAFTGNVVYYALEVAGIQMIGASLVVLLFGFMPIGLSLFGNILEREHPFSILVLPLALLTFGVMSIHFFDVQIDRQVGIVQLIAGILVTLAALFMWIWYAVSNSRFLKNCHEVDAIEFSTLVGVCCLGTSILIGGCMVLFMPNQMHLNSLYVTGNEVYALISVSVLLGAVVSWLGTILWNEASKRLPVTLSGQIVVSEILFGLLFIFIHDGRLPHFNEVVGMLFAIAGVYAFLYQIMLKPGFKKPRLKRASSPRG